MRIIIYFCLLILPLFEAGAAVVVTYRGSDPNIFPVSPPNPVSASLDVNGDGVDDFLFFRDAGFVSGIRGYGSNRVIATLAIPPDQGAYVSPIMAGSILGADTIALSGDWHHHTDNVSNPNAFFTYSPLSLMQSKNAYIGIEFEIHENIHYGWIHYIGFHSPDSGIPLDVLGGFINSWAYESEPGVPIIVGVPEPSTAILLMLGGIALVCRRNRK